MKEVTHGYSTRSIFRILNTVTILLMFLGTGITNITAATYLVTNLAAGGPGSLRRAIVDANATPDDDEIVFAPGVMGLIFLAGTELKIVDSGSLTITGPGPDQLTIAGGNLSRVIAIAPSANAVIDGVRISFGTELTSGGGGISNEGTLLLSNSVVSNNTAAGGGGGGIRGAVNSDTTIVNSIITGNTAVACCTGGITTKGTLTMSDSIVSLNSAISGAGGISSTGTMTISNSSIIDNVSNTAPGGIAHAVDAFSDVSTATITDSTIARNISNQFNGGGISISGSNVDIQNSTISHNSSAMNGGGVSVVHSIFSPGTSVSFTNSTISGNFASSEGGGIWVNGAIASGINVVNVTIKSSTITLNSPEGVYTDIIQPDVELGNTIVADNGENVVGTFIPRDLREQTVGAIQSLGFNLIGNGDGVPMGVLLPSDLKGTTNVPLDPLLGPLQNYGGPTETHSLLGGSPAIDAGDNDIATGLLFDQRGPGFPRVVNLFVDIGAFEVVEDPDGDGVPAFLDLCADTGVPEDRPPDLLGNRYYLNGDGEFEDADGDMADIDIVDAGGCSGTQIVDEMKLGIGHKKHGISRGALQRWVSTVP